MTRAGFGDLSTSRHITVGPDHLDGVTVIDPMVHLEVASGSDEPSQHPIGSVSMMRELHLALADEGVAIDPKADELIARVAASASGQRIDVAPEELAAIESGISAFARSVRRPDAIALALIDASPTVERSGLLRGWSHRITGRLLAQHGTVTVGVTDDGLGVWFVDRRRAPITDIRAFQLGVAGAVVTDGAGTVHIVDSEATSALNAVASESSRWRVRRVPEVLVWATVLAGVEAAVTDARAAGVGATIVVA